MKLWDGASVNSLQPVHKPAIYLGTWGKMRGEWNSIIDPAGLYTSSTRPNPRGSGRDTPKLRRAKESNAYSEHLIWLPSEDRSIYGPAAHTSHYLERSSLSCVEMVAWLGTPDRAEV